MAPHSVAGPFWGVLRGNVPSESCQGKCQFCLREEVNFTRALGSLQCRRPESGRKGLPHCLAKAPHSWGWAKPRLSLEATCV